MCSTRSFFFNLPGYILTVQIVLISFLLGWYVRSRQKSATPGGSETPVRDVTSLFIASKSTVVRWQQECRTLMKTNRDFLRTVRPCKICMDLDHGKGD